MKYKPSFDVCKILYLIVVLILSNTVLGFVEYVLILMLNEIYSLLQQVSKSVQHFVIMRLIDVHNATI